MKFEKNILITGGCGFIGSHVIRLFVKKYPDYKVINLDKLTYAGNLENITDVGNEPNYKFIKGDICDKKFIDSLFESEQIDGVINLAAESHVDRSISNPFEFVYTNIIGTLNLLNACKNQWNLNNNGKRFYQISTDEVFGSLDDEGFFIETTPYNPQSPYSASKASADHFVRAFSNTHKLPIVISNCSNNYGPNQFPEKLIPLAINNIKNNKPVPVYNKGENIRDWLYVEDHAKAIDIIFHKSKNDYTYNVGGFNEWKNIDLIKTLCRIMDQKLGRKKGTSEQLITFVKDRPGHDLRYAINAQKIKNELGWEPALTFEKGLEKTVDWYLINQEWLNNVTSGEYQKYYQQQYS